ncbi:uncharacterized protein TNCV_2920121 [Trichonephila clavipes]|nr:uncharacterized protein TNCV_2920121 [Trichonephila clavipes]
MMDDNNEMAVAKSNQETFEAYKVSVKTPPFWEEKPEIWFFQVEAQFSIANIKQEETKFNYLVSQLDTKFIENIWDIIQSDEKNKYSWAKNRLLSTFKDSEEKCSKKLLTGISLGDMAPSQLLRKMKSFAGVNISKRVLRTLWLDKLPDSIKNILVISSEDLENLSVMADNIFEINSSPEIYSDPADSSAMKNILDKVSLLEQRISELSINRRNSKEANFRIPIILEIKVEVDFVSVSTQMESTVISTSCLVISVILINVKVHVPGIRHRKYLEEQ